MGSDPLQMVRPTLVILQSNPNAAEIVVKLQSDFSIEAAVSPLSAPLEWTGMEKTVLPQHPEQGGVRTSD